MKIAATLLLILTTSATAVTAAQAQADDSWSTKLGPEMYGQLQVFGISQLQWNSPVTVPPQRQIVYIQNKAVVADGKLPDLTEPFCAVYIQNNSKQPVALAASAPTQIGDIGQFVSASIGDGSPRLTLQFTRVAPSSETAPPAGAISTMTCERNPSGNGDYWKLADFQDIVGGTLGYQVSPALAEAEISKLYGHAGPSPFATPACKLDTSGSSPLENLLFSLGGLAGEVRKAGFENLPVLSTGQPLAPVGEATVRVGCQSASFKMYPQGSTSCPAGGILVSKAFYEEIFPDLDYCIRKASGDETSPQVQIGELGIYSARNVAASTALSLHDAARAIDVSSVTIGSKSYNYKTDYQNRSTSPNWNSFWLPLSSCIGTLVDEEPSGLVDRPYFPLNADTELDLIREQDIIPSVTTALAGKLLGRKPATDDDGTTETPPVPGWNSKVLAVSDQIVAGLKAQPNASVLLRNSQFATQLDSTIQSQFGVTLTPTEMRSLLQNSTRRPILHQDHVHIGMPLDSCGPNVDPSRCDDLISRYSDG